MSTEKILKDILAEIRLIGDRLDNIEAEQSVRQQVGGIGKIGIKTELALVRAQGENIEKYLRERAKRDSAK